MGRNVGTRIPKGKATDTLNPGQASHAYPGSVYLG